MTANVARRVRAERGAALVELSIVATLLFLLVFGLIAWGLILGFKQTTEEAAGEGARAALVEYNNSFDMTQARAAGRAQALTAMASWEPTCDTGDGDGDGFGCHAYTHDCSIDVNDVVIPAQVAGLDTAAKPDCVTVVVKHDYANHPFLPEIPLLSGLLPSAITSAATVQVTD
ncbi:MAG TPA: TadE family protein [Acidimicrobiales bacterium]|jgi:Flp pilus assembly protein TadG